MLVALTRRMFATIDEIDADEVGKFSWQFKPKAGRRTGYAQRIWRDANGVKHGLMLHVFIASRAGLSLGLHVDHENTDGLDCRRQNLRAATKTQNQCNRGMPSSNTSGVKGVSWSESRKKYKVAVKAGAKLVTARFTSIEDAARFAERVRSELHGPFANHGSSRFVAPA